MKKYSVEELKEIIELHRKWLNYEESGIKANFSGADLRDADLIYANFRDADFRDADLRDTDLYGANLRGANFSGANFSYANLSDANFSYANFSNADLNYTNFRGANFRGANFRGANFRGAKGMIKIMGVMPGNLYYKRFDSGLKNNGYQFKVGLNELTEGDIFANDDRTICAYPGFHFASQSWCQLNYPERPLEALIRIPENAQINEPWATDGKASADKIEIIKIWEVKTGREVTQEYN